MRYYTKEWIQLLQETDLTTGLKKIPDKEYTMDEIIELITQKIDQWVKEEKREYNRKPLALDVRLAMLDEVELEDILCVDEDTGELYTPKNKDEIVEYTKLMYQVEMEEYENRRPFDEWEAHEIYIRQFSERVSNAFHMYPDWVLDAVDVRLLAIDLLPASEYAKLKEQEKKSRAAQRKIEREAEKSAQYQEERVDPKIWNGFSFHDDFVLAARKSKKNYEIILRKCEFIPGREASYETVIFHNAVVLEKDEDLYTRKSKSEDGWISNCTYLYDEIYLRDDSRYEIHMMLYQGGEKYLTIECDDVSFLPTIL